MNTAIQKLDRAIKQLYHLDFSYRAEDFLIALPDAQSIRVEAANLEAALIIHSSLPNAADDELELGLFFSKKIRESLESVNWWNSPHWTLPQMTAFTTATEEVSHFHYFVFNALSGRPVSQLELEIQGEIDKFLLAFFARQTGTDQETRELVESLMEQCFSHFSLHADLTEEQRVRYAEANNFAKRFICKLKKKIEHKEHHTKLLRLLRKFYRLAPQDRISWILEK